jgi:hypothetical protein
VAVPALHEVRDVHARASGRRDGLIAAAIGPPTLALPVQSVLVGRGGLREGGDEGKLTAPRDGLHLRHPVVVDGVLQEVALGLGRLLQDDVELFEVDECLGLEAVSRRRQLFLDRFDYSRGDLPPGHDVDDVLFPSPIDGLAGFSLFRRGVVADAGEGLVRRLRRALAWFS